ncbi:hypothetical protein GEMRC1_006709 [Eukaryota sp. GEM-RC1]
MSYLYDESDFEDAVPTPRTESPVSPDIEEDIPESPSLGITLPRRSPIGEEIPSYDDNLQMRDPIPSHPNVSSRSHPSRRTAKPVKGSRQPKSASGRSSSRSLDSSSLSGRLRIAEQQVDMLRRENKNLRKRLDTLATADRMTMLEDKLKEKIKLIEKLKSDNKGLEHVKQLQEQALTTPNNFESQLKGFTEEIRVLKEQNKSLKQQNTSNSQTVQRQVAEIGALRERLASFAKKSNPKSNVDTSVLNGELETFKKKFQEAQSMVEAQRKSKESVIKRYKTETSQLKGQISSLEGSVTILENEIAEQNRELVKLREIQQRYLHYRKAIIKRRRKTEAVESPDESPSLMVSGGFSPPPSGKESDSESDYASDFEDADKCDAGV